MKTERKWLKSRSRSGERYTLTENGNGHGPPTVSATQYPDVITVKVRQESGWTITALDPSGAIIGHAGPRKGQGDAEAILRQQLPDLPNDE